MSGVERLVGVGVKCKRVVTCESRFLFRAAIFFFSPLFRLFLFLFFSSRAERMRMYGFLLFYGWLDASESEPKSESERENRIRVHWGLFEGF